MKCQGDFVRFTGVLTAFWFGVEQSKEVYFSGLVSIIFHFFTNRKPKMKK